MMPIYHLQRLADIFSAYYTANTIVPGDTEKHENITDTISTKI